MQGTLVIAAALTLIAGVAGADTLELTDGRVFEGTYLGGNGHTVKFRIGQQTIVVDSEQVASLWLGKGGGGAPAQAPAAAPAPAPAPAPADLSIPAGTSLLVRMVDGVSSEIHPAGHRFSCQLDAPLTVNGAVVAPAGTLAYGRLDDAAKAGRMAGQAELRLVLTDIVIAGRRIPILTKDYGVKGERQGTVKKTAVGAGIGAIAGGKKGAKTGAAVGLGVAALTKGKQVKVPSGTLIEFRLLQAATVPGVLVRDAKARPAAPPAPRPTPQPAPRPAAPAAAHETQATVMSGTMLLVRMRDSVDSKRHRPGQRFSAMVETPVTVRGQVAIPQGAMVYGELQESKRGGRLLGRAELKVRLTEVVIGSDRYPLRTGGYEAKGERQGTLAKTGVGAGIGAIAGGKKGAKTGAAVGLGVAVLTGGKQVKIPSGTLLEFQLRQPVTIRIP
jgi:hypothetical protein